MLQVPAAAISKTWLTTDVAEAENEVEAADFSKGLEAMKL